MPAISMLRRHAETNNQNKGVEELYRLLRQMLSEPCGVTVLSTLPIHLETITSPQLASWPKYGVLECGSRIALVYCVQRAFKYDCPLGDKMVAADIRGPTRTEAEFLSAFVSGSRCLSAAKDQIRAINARQKSKDLWRITLETGDVYEFFQPLAAQSSSGYLQWPIKSMSSR